MAFSLKVQRSYLGILVGGEHRNKETWQVWLLVVLRSVLVVLQGHLSILSQGRGVSGPDRKRAFLLAIYCEQTFQSICLLLVLSLPGMGGGLPFDPGEEEWVYLDCLLLLGWELSLLLLCRWDKTPCCVIPRHPRPHSWDSKAIHFFHHLSKFFHCSSHYLHGLQLYLVERSRNHCIYTNLSSTYIILISLFEDAV